jgi:hypothetical protein
MELVVILKLEIATEFIYHWHGIILSRINGLVSLTKRLRFRIGKLIYWTHRLQYLITIHILALPPVHTVCLQFTSHALDFLGMLSHTSRLVPAFNDGRSPCWVPELFPFHSRSISWATVHPQTPSCQLHCTHLTLLELSLNCSLRTSVGHSRFFLFQVTD